MKKFVGDPNRKLEEGRRTESECLVFRYEIPSPIEGKSTLERLRATDKTSVRLVEITSKAINEVFMIPPRPNSVNPMGKITCLTSLKDDRAVFEVFLAPDFYRRCVGKLVKDQHQAELFKLTCRISDLLSCEC